MAATESRMLELGTRAPEFELPDASGTMHSLADADGADAVVVMFICNHCPFVKHVRQELAKLGRDCAKKNVAVFAINSNDAKTHPGDSVAAMRKEIDDWGYTFPYLVDETQQVARSYQAACTPDFFVFDREFRLVYRGQLDPSRPSNNIPVTGSDLRAAIDATCSGRAPNPQQVPSIGCNINSRFQVSGAISNGSRATNPTGSRTFKHEQRNRDCNGPRLGTVCLLHPVLAALYLVGMIRPTVTSVCRAPLPKPIPGFPVFRDFSNAVAKNGVNRIIHIVDVLDVVPFAHLINLIRADKQTG